MSILELIQLVKNNAAAHLTLEEADAVRAQLKETPHLYSVLGGREWVEEYLAALPETDGSPSAKPLDDKVPEDDASEDTEAAVILKPGQRATDVTAGRGRRWQLIGISLALLLGCLYWIYSARNPAHEKPLADANGTVDAANDAVTNGETPNDKKHADA
ncbi:MAG: hypothetical protein WBF93_03340, partial [Pirellulales bacterium]